MKVEERVQKTVATGFIKADFHIHTPESKCYSDPLTTSEQVVESALAAGLVAIAITDHNSVYGLDSIRELGAKKGLTVFPGMELSARGGHVLALFDPEATIPWLDQLLDYLGVSPGGKGDATIPLQDWIEDVFRKVDEWGGISIAAHIDRWPSGFLETPEHLKVKASIHNNQHLSALEITQPQRKGLWNKGQVRGYPKGYACIQGSDAHTPYEIGRRPIYLRLPSLDLKGLRLAFKDYESRVKFPDELAV